MRTPRLAFVVACSVLVSATGASGGPLDHFKGYNAEHVTPKVRPRTITLVDQFGQTQATLGHPELFMNPVDQNGGGINDPSAHLACYNLRDLGGHGTGHHRHHVRVDNEFGAQTFTVSKARLLCVPSEKNRVASALQLDHFKCYKVKASGLTRRFVSGDVTLVDQFGAPVATVLKLAALCNPVAVVPVVGIQDPGSHLACYKIKDAHGNGNFTKRDILVKNQLFGEAIWRAGKPQILCLPSSKTELPGPPDDDDDDDDDGGSGGGGGGIIFD